MLKILKDKWAKNETLLREKISELNLDYVSNDYEEITYKDLVELTFDVIYNDNDYAELSYPYNEGLKCHCITEVDNGEYQGTLLFLIPFDTYQPNEYEYLMTYIGYGSCSGCDLLQGIIANHTNQEETVSKLMTLCRDLVVRAVKPYNNGWRYCNAFEQVKFEEKENA